MSDAITEFEGFLGEDWEETGKRDASDFDPSWDFATVPMLIGRLQSIRSDVGKYKKNVYKFVDASVGETKDSMLPVGTIEAWGSTVLDQRLADYAKGDRVLIVYTGIAEGSNAHIFRTYRAKGVSA